MKGSFRLTTPAHLLAKMRHDLERMKQRRLDAYAAFDFFVTAEHMPDWLHPPANDHQEEARRPQLRRQIRAEPLFAVVSHIANNAKHFEARNPRHTHVRSLRASFATIGDHTPIQGPLGLFVLLATETAATLGIGARPNAVVLAERVLREWESKLELMSKPTP